MVSVVAALIAIMEEEKAIYLQLIELSKEKQGVLVKNEVDELGRIIKLEEAAVTRLMELDRKKTEAMSIIGRLRSAGETPAISDIAGMSENPQQKSRIEELIEDFRAIACELSAQNELNQRLIETQLKYANFCLELITQDESSVGEFYGSTGQVLDEHQSARRALFDRKA